MGKHSEKLGWPAWVHLALGLAVGLSIYGGASLLRSSWQGWIPLMLGAVLALIWWRIRFLVIESGADGIAFGFGSASRRVSPDRLRSAEAVDYSFSRYMGWGYRIGWKPRERAYSIIGYGRGIQLRFVDDQDREWNIFLSSRDPDAAVAALNKPPGA